MDWSENALKEYKERLETEGKRGEWTELKRKMQNAIQWKEAKKEGKKREKWWDKTCHEKKMKLKEKLRKCKNGDLEVEEYRQEKKTYKNWIERKKSEWNEKMLEEIENDKSEKSFWKAVNEGRKERQHIF